MGHKHLLPTRVFTVILTCLLVVSFLTACAGAPASQPASPTPASPSKPAEAPTKASDKPATSAATPTAQAKPAAVPGQAAKTIKIGALSPLTGPTASMGASAKRGYELGVEQVNNAGGIKSMGGAKLELLHEDHQMKADVAMGIVDRLIQTEKVPVIMGAAISAMTIATTQVAEKLATPHIVPMATADEITERGFKYTFRVSPNNSGQANFFIELLKWMAQKGVKVQKVALLYEDTAMGQGTGELLKKLITGKDGFGIVADVSYPAQGKDFSAQVAKLKAASPDVVLVAAYVGDAILLRKTMDQMGFSALLIGQESGVGHPEYLKAVGPLAEGEIVSTMSNIDLNIPSMPAYVKAYEAKWGQPPDNQATFHYQAVLILKEALEKAGSEDKEAIRKALSEIRLSPGPSSVLPVDPFRFDEKGQSNVGYIALQVRNGKLVTVWPEKFKAGDIILKK